MPIDFRRSAIALVWCAVIVPSASVAGTNDEASGANVEYYVEEIVTVSITYMVFDANLPDMDDLGAIDGRVEVKVTEALCFSGEFVRKESDKESDEIDADGWFVEARHEFAGAPSSPTITYAPFDGDDPDTIDDERFREMTYDYTDYRYCSDTRDGGSLDVETGRRNS